MTEFTVPRESAASEATPIMRESASRDMPARSTPASEARLSMHEGAKGITPAGGEPISPKGKRRADLAMRESARGLMPSASSTGEPMPPGGTIDRIMDISKTRNTWLQARNRLYLHALSLCRSACAGDKAEAVKLYKATKSGSDDRLAMLIGPFIEDIERWDARIVPLEKHLHLLIVQTPIGEFIKKTRGLGPLVMATLVGHTGPFDNYPTIAKLWKRLGLAISSDGAKRDDLVVPGICDMRPRRSAVYNIGASLMRASNADFRAIYDREKEKAIGKGWSKARANNHALRVGTKFMVKRMWKEWRNV